MGLRGGVALLVAVAAGCASSPPPPQGARIPEVLAGVPAAVLAARSVEDLGSADPERVASARRILLALPGDALEGWSRRMALAPEGTEGRLDYLAVLADRGDPPQGRSAAETVAACLREIDRDGAGERGTLISLAVLRSLGPEAAAPLRAEAERGGPRSPVARRLLRVLGLPERELRRAVP